MESCHYEPLSSLSYVEELIKASMLSKKQFQESYASCPIDNHYSPLPPQAPQSSASSSNSNIKSLITEMVEQNFSFQQTLSAQIGTIMTQHSQLQTIMEDMQRQMVQMAHSLEELMVPREDMK